MPTSWRVCEKWGAVHCPAGGHNMTAENITIQPFVVPSLPKLKDLLSPRVGDKFLQTDNQYQQERLLGSKLVHNSDRDCLLARPDVCYKKNVREEVPPVLEDQQCAADSTLKSSMSFRREMKRWTALPDIVEVHVVIQKVRKLRNCLLRFAGIFYWSA